MFPFSKKTILSPVSVLEKTVKFVVSFEISNDGIEAEKLIKSCMVRAKNFNPSFLFCSVAEIGTVTGSGLEIKNTVNGS